MSNVPGILIDGTPLKDSLVGTEGDDTINASTGVDTVRGLGGDDIINIIVADEFSDEVDGGAGVDTLAVRVQDTSGSYWMPTDMYWVGYTRMAWPLACSPSATTTTCPPLILQWPSPR